MNQEQVLAWARKAGIAKHGLGWTCWEGQLELFANLVAAAEREACAKVCEQAGIDGYGTLAAAAMIRARGEKPWVKTYSGGKPQYTTPEELEPRQWQGLTSYEIWQCNTTPPGSDVGYHICMAHQNVEDFAKAIEAKLKEKNT